MAAIRAEIPLWAGLLVTALAVAALAAHRTVFVHIERSLARGMGDPPKANAVMRLILRGGFLLMAGVWALAGLGVVLLNITGPIGD